MCTCRNGFYGYTCENCKNTQIRNEIILFNKQLLKLSSDI